MDEFEALQLVGFCMTIGILGLVAIVVHNMIKPEALTMKDCKLHTWRFKDDRGWLNIPYDPVRLSNSKLTCVLCGLVPDKQTTDKGDDF